MEAIACGTPIIALNEGGTAETIQNGFNGVLFSKQTKEDIIDAVNKFETMDFSFQNISHSAQLFSSLRFRERFRLVHF